MTQKEQLSFNVFLGVSEEWERGRESFGITIRGNADTWRCKRGGCASMG